MRRKLIGFVSDLNTVVLALVVVPLVVIYGLQMFGCAQNKGIAVFAYPMPACLNHAALLPAPAKKGLR